MHLLSHTALTLPLFVQEVDTADSGQQRIHSLLADSQEVQDRHNGLASRVQRLESLHASGQSSLDCMLHPGQTAPLPHQLFFSADTTQQDPDEAASNDAHACVGPAHDTSRAIAAVVIITYNRPEYLQKCITSVMQVHVADSSNRCSHPYPSPQ